MFLRLIAGAVAALLLGQPASAAWLEAQTDHFIIDADTSEAQLRGFAMRLERFDAALRQLYNVPDNEGFHANRVTIFAVGHGSLLRLCGGCSSQVSGFYKIVDGAGVIVTSALSTLSADAMTPQVILLHEYSHHFMYTSAPSAYPRWYTEGFAEFNSNVQFRPDGGIVLGLPAQYRAFGLLQDVSGPETGSLISRNLRSLSITQLLDPPPDLIRSVVDMDRFYGRSWLLVHYLLLSPTRHGQLAAYTTKYNHGTPSLIAAKEAFGDVNQLGADLSRYLNGKRLLPPLLIPPAAKAPDVKITALSPGASAMMGAHMQSSTGVTYENAKAALPSIVARAAAYPDDPRVQTQLAKATFDAKDYAAAESAADRALKVEPNDPDALLQKGEAALRLALPGGDRKTIAAARGWIVKANRAEPNAARPLIAYYRSFVAAGQPPSASAVDGLMRAAVVAPEDEETRWMLAAHFLSKDDAVSARQALQPIAFAPHAPEDRNLPRQVIDRIDANDIAGARQLLAANNGQALAEADHKLAH